MAILLGDIGGTFARFATLRQGGLSPPSRRPVAADPDPSAAIARYLTDTGEPERIDQALLAVAGPVEGRRARLVNGSWIFEADVLERQFGAPVRLLNDFEAVAWAAPVLVPGEDLRQIGPIPWHGDGKVAVLGPGTGLGLAAWLPAEGPNLGERVVVGEGGHQTIAAETEREWQVLAALRSHYGHVSAERLVSGPGLVNIYAALTGRPPDDPALPGPEAITAAAEEDAHAAEATELLVGWLAVFAGNAALAFWATGGVMIAGGVAGHLADHLAAPAFRERFAAKGRYAKTLAEVPIALVSDETPGLRGLAYLARRLGKA